ncbi:MAG: superoxide dismutase family protein [Polyangiaceae bacterium]
MKSKGTYAIALVGLLAACTRREPGGTAEGVANDNHPKGPAATSPVVAPTEPMPATGGAGVGGAGVGGAGIGGAAAGATTAASSDREAEGDFEAAKGYKLKGEAEFKEVAGGVAVKIEVTNGPPGRRGIHIHEKPDCSDIPGKSMGEHFNPASKPHALPATAERHLGDLGNIDIDKDGKGKLELTVPHANLKENDPMSYLRRAVVIHEAEDKGTQPSGDSGKPIACAVIKKD